MNRAIEIHDSTVGGVNVEESVVTVKLAPAYIHQSQGRPGFDPGTGWVQNIEIVFREAVVESLTSELGCWLHDGTFSIGEVTWENSIPLPIAHGGPMTLSAVTVYGERLIVRGRDAEAISKGEPRYVEPFPGSK